MPEILHELTIKAPPERVYRALTEPEGLAAWWTRDTRAEVREGSTAQFGFNDRSVVFKMKVERLEAGRRVGWRCLGGHPEWKGTRLAFELSPAPMGSVLRFGHRGWKSTTGILAMCSYDWARYLASLKSYLETGEGQPHKG